MNAHSSSFARSAATQQHSLAGLSDRWEALQDAGAAVGALAGLATEPPDEDLRSFPHVIQEAGDARYRLAERGISDLAAMMQPGLTALLSVHARGQDTTPAALTLWREFHAARSALLALVPPRGANHA